MSSSTANVRVRFWGTRGSIPTPGSETVRYGGNTSCIEVDCGGQGCFIFDAGSGIRALGDDIARNGRGCSKIHIFQSHLHWDHIQGLLFFGPLYNSAASLKLWCPEGIAAAPEEILDYQMRLVFFPISRSALKANIEFDRITTQGVIINDTKITACRVNHPGVVFAYRLSFDNQTVVYATDREPDDSFDDSSFLELCQGADLLIHDAQYTDEEYSKDKKGWGHSSYSEAVRVARLAEVKRLALFHHDPNHSDKDLDNLLDLVKGTLTKDDNFEVTIASEQTTIELNR